MKFIKGIELVLENCDTITIDSEYIGAIFLDDIKRDIWRCATNAIMDAETADHFAIEIFKEVGNYNSWLENEDMSVFDRLTAWQDITSVIVNYNNDEQETFFVHYDDNNIFCGNNKYQKSYISAVGNLYIVVSKSKNIEDYFEKEYIDDENATFRYGWYE